ncbi:helix-turn-helix domain-containing protein [Cohaesibacter celericrescens]|uniref:HTH cro/C1-type domain-containing protein n=1 Tax=Cohaesibacter celericrescens TaxID=2067669 RepID=A0A2N5XTR6_9HYPH|nr:helix-turn-helix transcriptional regulator [Cohaesibacter celericrescens]PLW77870.1 hypothetical protein C0081_07020 [Cohaesibacter celericrescens]
MSILKFPNWPTTEFYRKIIITLMVERFGKTSGQLSRWYLREWRKHRGLNQDELANAIDSTKGTISRMELGTRPYNQPFLEACAEVLNCSPADLLSGPPEENGMLDELHSKLSGKSKEQLAKILNLIDVLDS